jgi:23S rRNA (guanine745-N1)-methyltransferase
VIAILCPLCRLPLGIEPKAWRCAQNHSFDVAREGYVNLLPVQHKKTRDPGDSAEMLAARRAFLEAGHYAPLRDAMLALLAPLAPRSLVDIGCGEGWYTTALATVAADTAGIDIARTAIQLAAKRHRGITWLVASGAQLPVADASVDVVTSIFTQLHAAQIHRALAPAGHVLVVTPAADHLLSVRAALFEEVRDYAADKFLAELAPQFELQTRHEVRFDLALDRIALGQLLTMTPYAWRAKPEKRGGGGGVLSVGTPRGGFVFLAGDGVI